MDTQTAILMVGGFAFAYLVLYRKIRLLGNIAFFVLSSGIMMTADDNTQGMIAIVLMIGSLTNLVVDLITQTQNM